MLHVVQVVMWGVAETPQLFLEEAKARNAYVECAKKYWEQRYSAYCEHHGLSSDCFPSAETFVNTIDVSEKSRINYWTFNAEDLGLGEATNAPSGPGLAEFRRVAREIAAVRNGLDRLLDDVSKLTDGFDRVDVSPAEVQTAEGAAVELSPATVRQETPAPDPQMYTTPEWKKFVGMIKRLADGSRNEFYLFPRDDWRQDVYSNRTPLEYWDWVAEKIMRHKEKAIQANYSVIEEPAGCYKFVNQEGIASEDYCDSEWEAWCAAGLYLEENGRAAAG